LNAVCYFNISRQMSSIGMVCGNLWKNNLVETETKTGKIYLNTNIPIGLS
jgi:hypothetical protein